MVGVNDYEIASKIIKLGFEKIIFNNAIFSNIDLIKKFSENYGSQAIILRLNVIKSENI